jgi:hypothetical protein
MILSYETGESEQPRVYLTRANSVITYFTDDTDGGVAAHAHVSEFACPWSTTPEKVDAVKMAMLTETARRLQCRIDQVQLHTLEDIRKVCDPHLKHRYSWTRRSKARPRDGR